MVKKSATKKLQPIDDDIFFNVKQIKVGTILINMGRLTPNSLWRVVDITTYDPGKSTGTYRVRPVKEINRLTDKVTLKRLIFTMQGSGWRQTQDRREGTFQYLSYSAIWRLRR